MVRRGRRLARPCRHLWAADHSIRMSVAPTRAFLLTIQNWGISCIESPNDLCTLGVTGVSRNSHTRTNARQKTMSGFRIDSIPDLPPPYQCEKIREQAGLTEKQLADLVGVSDLSIQIWEAGVEEPSGMWRMVYAQVLHDLATRQGNSST